MGRFGSEIETLLSMSVMYGSAALSGTVTFSRADLALKVRFSFRRMISFVSALSFRPVEVGLMIGAVM